MTTDDEHGMKDIILQMAGDRTTRFSGFANLCGPFLKSPVRMPVSDIRVQETETRLTTHLRSSP